MSTTYSSFLQKLQSKLQPLTWRQRIHTINRLYEKLRVIHNAVGDVYQHRMTVQQFNQQYPTVSQKLQPILSPYIVGGYLTASGWFVFKTEVFKPRHDVICRLRSQLVASIKSFSQDLKNSFIQQNIIIEQKKIDPTEETLYFDNKLHLRTNIAQYEFDPVE